MGIEKVFAINASASDVYAALQRDIASASAYEDSLYDVLERERDRSIRLRVMIGFIPGFLTYELRGAGRTTEVAARFEPYGWRWVLFQTATLGMRRHSIEMVLAQGLINLKQEVEGTLDEEDLGPAEELVELDEDR